ncbi:flagellar protein FlaG [Noviherbaspirillum sp. DKR-6]|uniref:Flagellar protein FlaG n=2 Tax=Noviherbaspirillum pedocola TaxID=2801341 RepID=A0A934SVF6_9BURK|nr:flagellar protein FlaG [Noviherbaspirillum pedocola]
MQSLQKANLDAQAAQSAPAAQTAAVAKPTSGVSGDTASSSEAQKKELKGSVDAINTFLKTFSNNIEFSIDADSGRTVVKLVDTETNTVLRQYPTKEALALAKDIENLQGHLLKTEA